MHQPGSIELFFENKGEAEQSKRSELQHIDIDPTSMQETMTYHFPIGTLYFRETIGRGESLSLSPPSPPNLPYISS